MKKLLLTLIASIAFCGSMMAQYESHWPDFDYHDYPSQAPFVAAIEIDGVIVDDTYPGWDALEVAPFVMGPNGEECRGHEYWLYNGYVEEYGDPFPILDGYALYYENPGEEVYFKMWDHANGVLYTEYTLTYLGEPITILTGEFHMEGWDDPETPIIMHFTSPGGPTPVTFQLDIEGYGEGVTPEGTPCGYYLVSTPVGTVTPSADNGFLTDAYDLYYFDESQELEWINYKAGEYDLVSGKGYMYASAEDTQLEFTGFPVESETYPVVLTMQGDANQYRGLNLVGNPFTEAAYIDRAYYKMNEERSGIMPEPFSGAIAPMEGVFVVAAEDGEEMEFTLEEPAKGSMVAVNLLNSRGVIDRAIVSFGEGRMLPKFQLSGNHTKLYIPVEDAEYAVVLSEGMGEIPVNFKAERSGSYTLSVSSEEVSFSYLHLIDNMTGADVDLLSTPSYSFEASSSDYASRFRLVFATGVAEDSFGFFSNGSFIINNEGAATVQVIDVNGRILSSESINGSASISVASAAGVYMVRLINGESVRVQKVVVR